MSPEAAGAKRGEGVEQPFRALRKRANAVSARGGPRGSPLAGARRKGAPKSSRRVVGGIVAAPLSSLRRLPSTRSRVVVTARNQGMLALPSGPSPGKPRVLSNRLSGPTRSVTARRSRSCGDLPPSSVRSSPGRGDALWAPGDAGGPLGHLLGGRGVRPRFGPGGCPGAASAAAAAFTVAAFAAFAGAPFAGAGTSTALSRVVRLPAP